MESLTGLLSERLESGGAHLSSVNAAAAGGVEVAIAEQGYSMIRGQGGVGHQAARVSPGSGGQQGLFHREGTGPGKQNLTLALVLRAI